MLNIASDMAAKQGLSKDLSYEAQVIDNNDPRGLCRVRARVPFIFDGIPDEHLPWSIPSFDHPDGAGPGSGTAYVPKNGTKVLLRFQNGEATSPTWEGYPVDNTTKLQEMAHNYPDRKVTRLSNKTLIVIDTKSNEVFIRYPGDTRIYIEGNVELSVTGNVTEKIGGDRQSFIEGDSVEVVRGNRSVHVGGEDTHNVAGSAKQVVSGSYTQSTSGSSSRITGGSANTSIGGSDSYQVSGTATRNASTIQDNASGPSPSGPESAGSAPSTPDLDSWTGIDGGGPGAFIKGFSPAASPMEVASSFGEDSEGPLSADERAAYEKAGIKLNADGTAVEGAGPSNPTDTNTVEPTAAAVLPESCAAFADKTSFSPSMQLSTTFTLGDLSTKAVLERSAVQPQAGLTAAQIVCNLKGLAENMLDPITVRYGRPNINCGFRPASTSYGSATSFHLKGCAADLQWPGISDAEYYARAVWIKDNLPFSEVILEYGGNRPWIHVAFSASALSTTKFKTRVGVPSKYVNGILALVNKPGVGGA